MKSNPRHLAWEVLNRLERSGELLDAVVAEVLEEAAFPDARDRALFHSLVYGVLRRRGRLDWIVKHFSKTPLKKIEPDILNVIRLGLFQAVFLERIPVSAAVNTAVEMAKSRSPAWVIRFVNGVLRNAAANHRKAALPDPLRLPEQHLSVRESFPLWMTRRWIARFGFEEAEHLCAAANAIAPITVRANTLRATRDELFSALQGFAEEISLAPRAPDGITFSRPSAPVAELPMFREGGFQVQDEAAQLVTLLLEVHPGQKVLDACAGLGGKTGHLAQLMKNQGQLIAADRDAGKLARLEAEMQRLGATIVETTPCDWEAPIPDSEDRFDRILLDAPCSGLGVVRRNPDAKWRHQERDLARFGSRQQTLLSRLAALVSPSGILVYSVCSMEPEENERVIDAFLKDHPAFTVYTPGKVPAGLSNAFFDDRGCFRSYPHRHGMDGFFAAALIRRG